mgnify:FL=1
MLHRRRHGYKCTAPPAGTRCRNRRVERLTVMIFSFFCGPSSVKERFLLEANLPTVQWRAGVLEDRLCDAAVEVRGTASRAYACYGTVE